MVDDTGSSVKAQCRSNRTPTIREDQTRMVEIELYVQAIRCVIRFERQKVRDRIFINVCAVRSIGIDSFVSHSRGTFVELTNAHVACFEVDLMVNFSL